MTTEKTYYDREVVDVDEGVYIVTGYYYVTDNEDGDYYTPSGYSQGLVIEQCLEVDEEGNETPVTIEDIPASVWKKLSL